MVCRFGLSQYDDIIELFIRAGADVDSSSYWGGNALHWAIKFGNEKLAKKFIALGAERLGTSRIVKIAKGLENDGSY